VQKSPISHGTLEAAILASKRLYEVFAVAFSSWSNGGIWRVWSQHVGQDMDRSLVTEFREGARMLVVAFFLIFRGQGGYPHGYARHNRFETFSSSPAGSGEHLMLTDRSLTASYRH
jgi:hypothetical protein